MQVTLLGQAPPLTRLTQPEQRLYVALPVLCPLLLLDSTLPLTANTTQLQSWFMAIPGGKLATAYSGSDAGARLMPGSFLGKVQLD